MLPPAAEGAVAVPSPGLLVTLAAGAAAGAGAAERGGVAGADEVGDAAPAPPDAAAVGAAEVKGGEGGADRCCCCCCCCWDDDDVTGTAVDANASGAATTGLLAHDFRMGLAGADAPPLILPPDNDVAVAAGRPGVSEPF